MDSMLFITCQIEPNNNPQLQLKTRLSHVMSCFQTIMKALVKNKAVQELRLENQVLLVILVCLCQPIRSHHF
jgi:hypothetical protein